MRALRGDAMTKREREEWRSRCNEHPEHLHEPQSCSPHLTKAQARRVAKALLEFADAP